VELPRSYPFSRLHLPAAEDIRWHCSNPTFHRFDHWGMVITDEALYWFKPAWWLGRWLRLPLGTITDASFRDSRWRPSLILSTVAGTTKCQTPHDSYSDEMDFDRRKLLEALELIRSIKQGGNRVP
jgi:hypothetical protein